MNALRALDEMVFRREPLRGQAIGAAPLEPVLHTRPTGRRNGAVDVTCAGRDGQLYGWVRVRPGDLDTVIVENLNVVPQHRGAGLGVLLLASALAVGARWGRERAHLEADDRGSGRLLRWYEALGFERIGTGWRGLPALEAPIAHALPKMYEMLSKERRR